jgi:hypothetical protein
MTLDINVNTVTPLELATHTDVVRMAHAPAPPVRQPATGPAPAPATRPVAPAPSAQRPVARKRPPAPLPLTRTPDPAQLPTAADAHAAVLGLLIARAWEAAYPGQPCPGRSVGSSPSGRPWVFADGSDAPALRTVVATACLALKPDGLDPVVRPLPDAATATGTEVAMLAAFQRAVHAEIIDGRTSPYALMGRDLVRALGTMAGHYDLTLAATDPRAAARQMVQRWAAREYACPDYLRRTTCDRWFDSGDPADGPGVRSAVARYLGDHFRYQLATAQQHVRREEGTLRNARRRLAETWYIDERKRLAKRIRDTKARLALREDETRRWARAVRSPTLAGRDAHKTLLAEIRLARQRQAEVDAKRRAKELAREKAAILRQRAADARREKREASRLAKEARQQAREARQQANASAATTPAPTPVVPASGSHRRGRPRNKSAPSPKVDRAVIEAHAAAARQARARRGFQHRLGVAIRAARRGVPCPAWPDVDRALTLDAVLDEIEADARDADLAAELREAYA